MNERLQEVREGLERLRDHHADMARRMSGLNLARADHEKAEAYAARIEALDQTVAALRLAFPLICDGLRDLITSSCHWEWSPDSLGNPVHEVLPDSVTGREAVAAQRELAVVRALAAALGCDLPADLLAVLPAVPLAAPAEPTEEQAPCNA